MHRPVARPASWRVRFLPTGAAGSRTARLDIAGDVAGAHAADLSGTAAAT
jgi:hypothetical protein